MKMEKKRYKFHLNTSTTCFLCFMETATFESDINFQNIKDRIGSECKVSKSHKINLNTKCATVVSLQRILSYLKINLSKIKSLSPKAKSFINKTDVRVTLCSECEVTAEKFSELCMALELIEMKLEYSLEGILRRLNTVQNNPTLVNNYQSKITECEDSQLQKHSKVVEELRREIRLKCDAVTPKYQPSLNLKREKLIKKEPSFDMIDPDRSAAECNKTYGSDYYDDNDDQLPFQEERSVIVEAEIKTKHAYVEDAVHSLSLPSSQSSPTIAIGHNKTTKQKHSGSKWIKNNKTGAFDCSICKRSFTRYQNVIRHYETAHLQKRHTCSICKNTFAQKSYLSLHQLICKLKFPTKLTTSKARKHDHRRQTFRCRTCKNLFSSKYNMEVHNTTVHLNERNFRCKVCNKTFKAPKNLKEHQQSIHLGIKFCCKFCSKSFDSRGGKVNHEIQCSRKTIKTDYEQANKSHS